MKNVAIVGGGASGLMCAIVVAQAAHTVHLFEQNEQVGKKILASGNGRCNISNTHLHVTDYFGENPAFVAPALEAFSFTDFEAFCAKMGLLLHTKEDGRAYPRSFEAKAVTSALLHYARHCGVTVYTQTPIKQIEYDGELFRLHVNSHRYHAVVIATGSLAAPQLGANDSGHTLARQFHHTIVPPYPSLVQLHLKSRCHHKLSGVKQHAGVTLYIDNKKRAEVTGDILFTKYGISGFAILDISHHASFALMHHHNVTLGIDLFESMPRQQLLATLKTLCSNLSRYTIVTILALLTPSKMAPFLLHDAAIDAQTLGAEMQSKQIKKLTNILKDWRFNVTQTHGFKHAEVSGGGVDTLQINPETMESLHVKGLYFAGEVCDVVGRRGGYNLHFAWASGYLAAKAISTL